MIGLFHKFQANLYPEPINRYQVMLLFVIGSMMGYLIEMLWYRHLRGRWINRQGVIYGPYSPIYGIALTGFVLLFHEKRKVGTVFFWGSILGSLFEYICGYLQEKVLGTKSWDYSKKPFNIHGRICLEFSFYWGVIACAVTMVLYPLLNIGIEKFLYYFGNSFAVILFVSLLADCVVSGLACMRQRARREGQQASNRLECFLDKHYPDERLEQIFTEIRILNQDDKKEKELIGLET